MPRRVAAADRTEIAGRRRRVAEMYLARRSQYDIASELGVDQSTISRDLTFLRKEWLDAAVLDFNEAKARELARIDNLEAVYWQSWERSLLEQETTLAETSRTERGSRTKTTLRKENTVGDPRFLQGVQWCIDKRCAILGIEAPKKTDITSGGEKLKGYIGISPDDWPE